MIAEFGDDPSVEVDQVCFGGGGGGLNIGLEAVKLGSDALSLRGCG